MDCKTHKKKPKKKTTTHYFLSSEDILSYYSLKIILWKFC